MDNLPAAIGALALAGTGPANILTNVVTMAWPTRPTWVAPVMGIVFGILSCTLITFVTVPANQAIDRQMWGTIVAAGITAYGMASGIQAAVNTAEAKRVEAQYPPEPEDVAPVRTKKY